MDLPDSFQTVAEIGIGLAGFSGLIIALRKRSGPLSNVQKYRLRILMALSFGAMFLALMPGALLNLGVPEKQMWFYCCLTMAIYSIGFLLWWIVVSRRVAREYPEIFNWIAFSAMAAGHSIILILQLFVVLVEWAPRNAGIFNLGLIWYLIHASQQFARMLFIQPLYSESERVTSTPGLETGNGGSDDQ